MHLIFAACDESQRRLFQDVTDACFGVSSVHLCANIQEAQEWMEQHTVDMALVHCRTSQERDDAKELIAQHASLPVVMVADDGRFALDAWRMQASGYILTSCMQEELQRVIHKYGCCAQSQKRVEIQTIPSFAVSIDGKPLHISAVKPRELFALLVDCAQRGLTTAEGIAILWPDKNDDAKTRSLFRMTYKRLNSILEEAGVGDIIASNNNKRYLQMDKVSCDLYQILEGNQQIQKRYVGLYMQEYSWAEDRNAQLYRMILSKN